MHMLPNFISFLRMPLAFLFLQENPLYRCIAILLAMLTDGLDGFLARRYQLHSKLGTLLDPLMDKFFVVFVLVILLQESRITEWQAITMLCRDFSVIVFGVYLAFTRQLTSYQFRAIWCGKIATCLQLLVLIGLTCHMIIPDYVYGCFVVLGLMALIELYLFKHIQLA